MKNGKEHDDEGTRRRPSSRPVIASVCVALYQNDESEIDYGYASVATLHKKAKEKKPAQG